MDCIRGLYELRVQIGQGLFIFEDKDRRGSGVVGHSVLDA